MRTLQQAIQRLAVGFTSLAFILEFRVRGFLSCFHPNGIRRQHFKTRYKTLEQLYIAWVDAFLIVDDMASRNELRTGFWLWIGGNDLSDVDWWSRLGPVSKINVGGNSPGFPLEPEVQETIQKAKLYVIARDQGIDAAVMWRLSL